jgi:hypothetical protein
LQPADLLHEKEGDTDTHQFDRTFLGSADVDLRVFALFERKHWTNDPAEVTK